MILPPKPLFVLACTAALTMMAGQADAQSYDLAGLFGPETFKAWADLRLTTGQGERGWLSGGFGKTRYGDQDGGAHLAQAAIAWQPRLLDTVTAYVLVQDVPDSHDPFGVEEAYIKWKPVPTSNLRYSVRLGQLFVPVSQEHDGAGWTPSRTLTPSAINSWIGEEVLVDGLEGSVQLSAGDSTYALTAGAFTRDDTAGTIIAWRGWALHDISSAESSFLPLPEGDNQGWYRLFQEYQAPATRPLKEVDQRLGYYVRFDWRPPAPVAVNLEVYDNQGDANAVRNGQWGWATRFYNLGMTWQPAPRWEVLSQYMAGHTAAGWPLGDGNWAIDARFDSAYLLAARKLADGARVSARVDYFAVKDGSKRWVDDNTDKGYAATLAWLRPLNGHLDLAAEALRVQSNHPARVTQGIAAHQTQTQLQIALKLHL